MIFEIYCSIVYFHCTVFLLLLRDPFLFPLRPLDWYWFREKSSQCPSLHSLPSLHLLQKEKQKRLRPLLISFFLPPSSLTLPTSLPLLPRLLLRFLFLPLLPFFFLSLTSDFCCDRGVLSLRISLSFVVSVHRPNEHHSAQERENRNATN